MKKTAFFLSMLCLLSAPVFAADAPKLDSKSLPLAEKPADPKDGEEEAPKSLEDSSFIVETSEDDAFESLNRVSGKFDRGYASEEQTSHATHQKGRMTPFDNNNDPDRSRPGY